MGEPQGSFFPLFPHLLFAAPPGLQMKSPEKKRRKSNTQVSCFSRLGWGVRATCPPLLCEEQRELAVSRCISGPFYSLDMFMVRGEHTSFSYPSGFVLPSMSTPF